MRRSHLDQPALQKTSRKGVEPTNNGRVVEEILDYRVRLIKSEKISPLPMMLKWTQILRLNLIKSDCKDVY